MRTEFVFALVLWTAPHIAAADVLCARTGEAPFIPDTSLTEQVSAWTTRAQSNLKMQVPVSKGDALKLQASVAQWADQAPFGTVDYFFRQALGHGINAQYERLMITLGDGDAAKHTYFMHLEAARADACLSLLTLR